MRIRPGTTSVVLSIVCVATLCVATHAGNSAKAEAAAAGGAFDAAPFAMPFQEADGRAAGLRWAEPRKIRQVEVEFEDAGALSVPLKLQYWHRTWSGRPDPLLSERGAGGVGWDAIDDWTNGEWKDADAKMTVSGAGQVAFTFNPTGEKEFSKLGHPGVTYRRTLKIRVAADSRMPRIRNIRAFTDAAYRRLSVRIHLGSPAEPAISVSPVESYRLEIFNGVILHRTGESGSPIEADILRAEDPVDARYDRTIVTVRSASRPFSFAADEVARGDRILVDDLGALVVRGDDKINLEAYRRLLKAESAARTVYDRVSEEQEQTLQRAWGDMPLKRPLYFVHGLPGNRNAMRQLPDGTIEIAGKGRWFDLQPSARDSGRKHWKASIYGLEFGFPPDNVRGGRDLKDGYLPQLRTWWQQGPIYYEQDAILDKLDGKLGRIDLDDPTLLLMRVRFMNTSAVADGIAALVIRGREESVRLDGDRIMADYEGSPRMRCLLRTGGRGEVSAEGRGIRWSLRLKAGESWSLFFAVPSVTIAGDAEIEAVRKRDFDADAGRICRYWRDLTDRGTRIITSEPWLDDFHKAHARHLMVNCYKELGSDRLHAHVGTFSYGDYPNESIMMISDLDRRGYHEEAQRCLDNYLHNQGTVAFLGNYRSKDGMFYGSGGHETGNYNKSHGYIMWGMANHWWTTRDRAWMEKAAPKLVRACEWVMRERQATMRQNADGSRPIEYGFLPTGSLEDVTDFWHWLATNSATVWGFDAVAGALADFGHPDAGRLKHEASAYHADVVRGLAESRVLAPVVRLRDGTYVPKYPSRLYERGRAHGWLRETLEGSIFLLYYKLIPPESPDARWILKDYEDNLYISSDYGYAIPAFDTFWFSRGGFSMQAQLLDGPPPYLYRDEIKHYLRAYFNGFCSAFYPDIRMCNEHSLPELGYPAGDHFKSSDEAQSTSWLRLMFVYEDGADLHLGRAIPRYWLTQGKKIGVERAASCFGPLSWFMTSDVDNGQIKAIVTPPARNRPANIFVRFRHPAGKLMQSVTVNEKPWVEFDAKKEWVVLPGKSDDPQEIVVRY
jgi:hypothetical protein